jgi:hypothetical protein
MGSENDRGVLRGQQSQRQGLGAELLPRNLDRGDERIVVLDLGPSRARRSRTRSAGDARTSFTSRLYVTPIPSIFDARTRLP